MVEKKLVVKNRAGIHARPAALITQTANKYASEVLLVNDDMSVNAKSIMGVIAMALSYNSTVSLQVTGDDENEAALAIEALFESKFEED